MRASSARLLGCAGACLCLFGASTGRAGAAELSVSLRYAAGPTCPDAAGFKSVVAARLGYDPFRDDAADHVLVRISGRASELDGRIEWRDGEGKWAGDQNFPSASTDCSRLARAMGLALAVQIQLLAGTRAAAPAEAAPPVTPAPAEPGPAPMPPARPAVAAPASEPAVVPAVTEAVAAPAAPAPRPSFAVGAGPSLGVGLASETAVLGRLFGAAMWPRFSVELGVQASLSTTARRMDGAGFSQRLMLVTAAGCAGGAPWSGCLLVGAGVVSLAGRDVDVAMSARVPLVNAGARVGLTQRLGPRAFLYAHADGLTNVISWVGEVDHVPVWSAPRFAAALGLDAGIRFP